MILILKTKSRGNFQLSTYLNVFEDSDKLDRAGDTQAICVDIKLRSNWFQSKEFQLTTARQPCRGKTWGGCGKFYRHQGGRRVTRVTKQGQNRLSGGYKSAKQ